MRASMASICFIRSRVLCALIKSFSPAIRTFSPSCHARALHSKLRDLPVPVGDSMSAFCFPRSAAITLDMVIFCGTCGLRPLGKCTDTPPIGKPPSLAGSGCLGKTLPDTPTPKASRVRLPGAVSHPVPFSWS